jgi:hypothetical protein
VVETLALGPGYLGTLTFDNAAITAPDAMVCSGQLTYGYARGGHVFTVQVGAPVLDNGAPMGLQMSTLDDGKLDAIYDALTSVFDGNAGIAWTGCQVGGCFGAGVCPVRAFTSGAWSFSVPQLGLTVWLQENPSIGADTVTAIDLTFDCTANAHD